MCGCDHSSGYAPNGFHICDECWPEALANLSQKPHAEMLCACGCVMPKCTCTVPFFYPSRALTMQIVSNVGV